MKNFAVGFFGTVLVFVAIFLYSLLTSKWPYIVLPIMAFLTCCIGGWCYRRMKDGA